MDESILNSVKTMLGGNLLGEDAAFDAEIIPLINLALGTLVQLGAGPSDGYSITGSENLWSEFSTDKEVVALAKQYCFLKVKVLWDNSTLPGAVIEVYKEQIKEIECRINYWVDPGLGFK